MQLSREKPSRSMRYLVLRENLQRPLKIELDAASREALDENRSTRSQLAKLAQGIIERDGYLKHDFNWHYLD